MVERSDPKYEEFVVRRIAELRTTAAFLEEALVQWRAEREEFFATAAARDIRAPG